MEPEKIQTAFVEFLKNYDRDLFSGVWEEKSKFCHDFWKEYILNKDKPMNEADIDQIIRILDRNGKGNTKKDSMKTVAKAMIPQGAWRRMFFEIKQNEKLRQTIDNILQSDGEKLIQEINNLYEMNKGKKNNLTGKSANAINAMLFAFNPKRYVSVISLNDRQKIIEQFGFGNGPNFETDSPGVKVEKSNKAIIDGFRGLGIDTEPRTISVFLYTAIKDFWKPVTEEIAPSSNDEPEEEMEKEDKSTFYLEKELENFLITNWEKTSLGKDYELIEEDGDMKSQQYPTDIGQIDILVRDKKTKQYVVIELKRNQTSDDTVGQLLRYMGWVEEKKSPNKPVKGIIIAANYDHKLYYALKKVKDVEVFEYVVHFNLKEFKKP